MSTEYYSFNQGKGIYCIKGKPHWPSMIRLELNNEQALDLAIDILNRIKNNSEIDISLFGELQKNNV